MQTETYYQVVTIHGDRDVIHTQPYATIREAEEAGERRADRDDDATSFYVIDQDGFSV